ncbi:hypothetical protein EI982_07115 [Haloplanus rallus]|jgi:predicted Na+-dependent transporter|uniref:Bile acid:sodium symporter family protein n=1 Tax=Haloplanus rallus TaxID=1816183 RepID=A0A6B9F888_9EURY|nr:MULTISPECIES: bile acid:sodium symporter [Haloplanus]QGX94574.1 hypothetical protein EI982_07115 [Haloplanus rallus]
MTPRTLLARGRNVVLVVAAAALGTWFPQLAGVGSFTLPIVAFLVYISLRDVDPRSLASGVPLRALTVGLAVSYAVLPAGAFLLGPVLATPEHRVGLYVVSAVPITAGSSIVWTRLSDGDVELAALVAVTSIVLSPVVTPPVLSALVGSTVALSPGSVVSNLLFIVGGGVGLRVVVPDDALSASQLDAGARASIAVLVYAGVAGVDPGRVTADLPLLSVTTATLLLVGFVASVGLCLLCGLAPGVRSAVFFSGSLKNLGVSLLVVDVLGMPAATVVVVVYYVLQQVVGALAADLLFPWPGDEPSESTV